MDIPVMQPPLGARRETTAGRRIVLRQPESVVMDGGECSRRSAQTQFCRSSGVMWVPGGCPIAADYSRLQLF